MKIAITLTADQAAALAAVVDSLGRTDVRDLADRGVSVEVQPAVEALVALSAALKQRR